MKRLLHELDGRDTEALELRPAEAAWNDGWLEVENRPGGRRRWRLTEGPPVLATPLDCIAGQLLLRPMLLQPGDVIELGPEEFQAVRLHHPTPSWQARAVPRTGGAPLLHLPRPGPPPRPASHPLWLWSPQALWRVGSRQLLNWYARRAPFEGQIEEAPPPFWRYAMLGSTTRLWRHHRLVEVRAQGPSVWGSMWLWQGQNVYLHLHLR